ncbi:glycosyltransferase [Novosphingobium sp. G106]|uniref:glycosyltransferase n=1 Tax=Novosphingobium sp. G106 TaxID=2849500 RepID=UPI001C2D905B|nr:glycosyltransferase [Novosphingobium sp. G106]MBV1687675.1 glycosyltransferase [Novosphingobium sp. G106]
MRILSISTLFPNPQRPSFGKFVANQMRTVTATDDVDLTMVSPIGLPPWPLSRSERYRKLGEMPERSDTAGIPALHPRFTLIPKVGGDSNPGRIAKALLPLAKRLHAAKPFDVVDAQFFFPDGPAAAIIADELGLPLMIKARGSDIHFWGQRPRAVEQMLRAAEQAAGLLAVSYALRGDMIALGMPEAKIAVHYTGLDRERFHPMERKAARALVSAIPELDIWAEGPLIVTPGSLIAIKGQRLAIEALAQLPDAHLALAGAGEDETALRQVAGAHGVADRVQFLGQVGHELLPQLFSAADAVVLPSEREGLANVWVEALACGAPLVIPDIGGAREVVAAPSAGRIAARDASAIASAVREILADPPSQEAVAANAERFSWEANAAELIAFWRNLARR